MPLARTSACARAGVVLIAALCGIAPPARAEPPAHGGVAQGAPQKESAASEARAARALARLSRALKAKHTNTQALMGWAAEVMPADGLHTSPPSTAEVAPAARFIALAEPFLTRVPALAPHLAEAYARAGDFARAQGLLEQAFRDVEAPAPSQGDTAAAQPALAAPELLENATLSVASLAHAGGDALLAEQLLRAGLARTPRSSVLLAGLGLLLVSSGRADEALPYLSARRELGARTGLTRPYIGAGADLAYALMASGAPEAAHALLTRSCDADPDNCAALRVRAALESGEVTDALRTAEEALSRATQRAIQTRPRGARGSPKIARVALPSVQTRPRPCSPGDDALEGGGGTDVRTRERRRTAGACCTRAPGERPAPAAGECDRRLARVRASCFGGRMGRTIARRAGVQTRSALVMGLSVLAAPLGACGSDDDACRAGSASQTVAALVPSGSPIHCENARSFTVDGRSVRFSHVAYGAREDCPSGCFSSHLCAVEDGDQTQLFYAFWTAAGEQPRALAAECPALAPAATTTAGCVPSGALHPLASAPAFRSFAPAQRADDGPFRWCFDAFLAD
jgi:tetratricopeptide (TPR) repeat protein